MYHLQDKLFRTIFDLLEEPRLIVKANKELTVILANKAYIHATGTRQEDLSGKAFLDLAVTAVPGGPDKAILLHSLTAVRKNGLAQKLPAPVTGSGGLPVPAGQQFWETEVAPVAEQQEEVSYLLLSFHNVTGRMADKKALSEAYDKEQDLLLQQQELNEELAATNEELASANEELAATNEELTTTNEDLIRSQEKLESLNRDLEYHVRKRTEELSATNERLQSVNQSLLRARNDLINLIEKLTESEDRFRAIFEQAPVGMCLLKGKEQRIVLVNDNMLAIWGRSREEVLNKPHRIARPELNGQPVGDWLDEVYETGVARTNTELKVLLHHEGGLREAYVDSLYQPLRDADGRISGLLAILTEVTALVKERQQTERTQEQLRLAIDSAELGTWFIDPKSGDFNPSPRLKILFGYPPEATMSLQDAILRIREDYRRKVTEAIDATLNDGEPFKMEYPVTDFHDGQLRWLRATGRLFRNASGEPAHFSGTVLDITERKLEEIRKNDFIAIASHELKTPLTSVKAYLQMLQGKGNGKGETDTGFLNQAVSRSLLQVEKMHILIKGFLNISRLESSAFYLDVEDFDLNELIAEVAEEMRLLAPAYRISFSGQILPPVWGDREKIGQVISNLISNAVKYSEPGSAVEISSYPAGEKVTVKVLDHGTGISKQNIKKLFGRFQRIENKKTSTVSGFGIGLYLCKEIVLRHKGEIWAESEPGKGSSFFFTLPVANNNSLQQ